MGSKQISQGVDPRHVPEVAGADDIVGDSPAMERLRALTRQVGRSQVRSILLVGESGTGKGLVARALHAESDRRGKPFIPITCSAIPEQLLESELFGHEAGAFTDGRTGKMGLLEAADGGTLFLDEIGDMPAILQAKLLGVLEDRRFRRVGGLREIPIDVKVVSATHRDLSALVAQGLFREDLLYRLAVVPIRVPSLSEHPEDIPALAAHFSRAFFRGKGANVTITEDALRLLQARDWPGNARELRNAVERAIVLSDSETLPIDAFAWNPDDVRASHVLPPQGLDVEEVVNGLVRAAMDRTGANQSAAARLLGMTRNQLRYRLEKLGLLPSRPGRSQGTATDGSACRLHLLTSAGGESAG